MLLFLAALKHESLPVITFRIKTIHETLKLLAIVTEGILSIFCLVTLTIEEQLTNISAAAHVLILLRGKGKNSHIIPNQLYHDLQSTYLPDLPVFLILLGSDSFERLFGNMRMKFGATGMDSLHLIFCSHAMKECQDILEKHPSWTRSTGKTMKRMCLDYSKPTNWQVEKMTLDDVNISNTWNLG